MRRMRLLLEYDGTEFHGFQRQPDQPTIQGSLEKVLSRLSGHPVTVTGAGRTDAGVHAVGQVVHWDTTSGLPVERWERGLNALLTPAIRALHVERTDPGFHARFSAVRRTYQYYFSRERLSPLLVRYVAHAAGLREDAAWRMREALLPLRGRLDVGALGRDPEGYSTVRTIHRTELAEAGPFLRLEITADGFLRSMVRNLMGLLIEVGQGRREPDALGTALERVERPAGLVPAAPHGLYLVQVEYPDGYPQRLARVEERLGPARWFSAPEGPDFFGEGAPAPTEVSGGERPGGRL